MQPDVACVHEFRKNNSLLLACLDNMPLAAAIIRLDLDKTGNPEDFTFVYANEALAELENVPLDRLLGAAFYLPQRGQEVACPLLGNRITRHGADAQRLQSGN